MRTILTRSTPILSSLLCGALLVSCTMPSTENWTVYETSESGNQLTEMDAFEPVEKIGFIEVNVDEKRQQIVGFGGAFTEASAYLLNQLGAENREAIINNYFGPDGARYSLTRTHMNSCDFSRTNYSYTPVEGDTLLEHFSIDVDRADLIPMIKSAQAASADGFKIFASPWTAAPWMKDNNSYVGGKLLPEYYDTWALFFSKYVDAYSEEGIYIWGFTVENEPLGNGNNWESMIYSPEEMTHFVQHHLGPKLEADGKGDLKILGYDQNRQELAEWVDAMFATEESSKYFDGVAVHWYESTYDYFPDMLDYAHDNARGKLLLQTEACVDAEVPVWQDDPWYWKKEATDWGYTWREPENKYLHPKYAPVNRYARDIIGCLNHWVQGWVDWNMVLDKQGGPNWKQNWCIAPVIVDPEMDEVYYTPIFYVLNHFSRFIRPEATILGTTNDQQELMVTAAENPDGSIAVVVFNEGYEAKSFELTVRGAKKSITINPQAIQTITIEP